MPLAGTKIGHDEIIRANETIVTDYGRVFTPVEPMTGKQIVELLHATFLLRHVVPLARGEGLKGF